MNNTLIKIRDRIYEVDFTSRTFVRITTFDGYSVGSADHASHAKALLALRYSRPELTLEENEAANDLAFACEAGEEAVSALDAAILSTNALVTSLRILKEREFLRAVAIGDLEKITRIESNERGAAMFAKQSGGHQIGSIVMTTREAA